MKKKNHHHHHHHQNGFFSTVPESYVISRRTKIFCQKFLCFAFHPSEKMSSFSKWPSRTFQVEPWSLFFLRFSLLSSWLLVRRHGKRPLSRIITQNACFGLTRANAKGQLSVGSFVCLWKDSFDAQVVCIAFFSFRSNPKYMKHHVSSFLRWTSFSGIDSVLVSHLFVSLCLFSSVPDQLQPPGQSLKVPGMGPSRWMRKEREVHVSPLRPVLLPHHPCRRTLERKEEVASVEASPSFGHARSVVGYIYSLRFRCNYSAVSYLELLVAYFCSVIWCLFLLKCVSSCTNVR